MKRLGKKEELCIGCNKCEEICSSVYFKESLKEKSSIYINMKSQGGYGINICNQCGECIEICQVEALYRDKNRVVRIKKQDCVGCFMCVGFCPEEAMRQHDDFIEPFKCVACGLCAKNCPTGAIFIENVDELEIEAMGETATAGEQ
ncbi:Fe-S-cluster-containing hydrogenase component 2 [Anaerosolibacter carboniphilus]|uniref:Fe-S-cluster-containing hydrogenase component 2 n=1 Tax=Anaerosolibacter carboniphilus TaxID=1417629 RepID=A0A841L066_9FIRM|nr:4Fe-4S dicluster domain-containing protein [Anaerosolibacter carboniphilus]MBB6216552.1 Fe-S-cluster-containing hydrogenase component 2 [Anaerosolibacter carboniphilus]